MIRCVAVDDEPLALEIIHSFSAKLNDVVLEKTFTKVDDAISYLNKNTIDLLFLDIHMPKMTGIDLVKTLTQLPMIIFSTAHSKYAVEGFNLNAIDYLLKPYSFERFTSALEKAKEFYNYIQNQSIQELSSTTKIFFRTNYSLVAVEMKDINLIESFGDNLTIHYEKDKQLNTRMTMKTILEKLPKSYFVRVHRSYIVPMKHLANSKNKTIQLNDKIIPIGVRYEKEIMNRIKKI